MVGRGTRGDRGRAPWAKAVTNAFRAKARLTSLLLVEERLAEAEYFATRLFKATSSTVLGYELNAFLSAARSVTFLLQKEFAHVEGFETWWQARRRELGADIAARFFLELRNYSQKEGRVSVEGFSSDMRVWHFVFAATVEGVPHALLNRNVADCCLEHVAKLAQVTLDAAREFPFHSCPARALTPEGVAALGIDLDEIGVTLLGIPPEFWAVRPAGFSIEDRVRVYRRYVDAVDFDMIERLAAYAPIGVVEHDDHDS
jgi:hypothetical protein